MMKLSNITLTDLISLVIVGSIWGCTNSFLRRGTLLSNLTCDSSDMSNNTTIVANFLSRLRNIQVILPYVLNQCGSLLYYNLLSTTDLSLAVPICNGLALVFSVITSHFLGEQMDKPVRALLGSTMLICGVCICILTTEDADVISESTTDSAKDNHIEF